MPASTRPFSEVRDVPATALDTVSGALRQVHAGEFSALMIRQAFPPGEMAEAVARLEADGGGFEERRFGPQFEAYVLGCGLDFSEDLTRYLDGEPAWSAACARLFEGLTDFEGRLDEIFAVLAGELPVERPHLRGRPCLPDTIRRLPPGGLIPPHAEMEQTTRAPYLEMNPLLDGVTIISYFVCLAAGDGGGELAVHDLTWGDVDESVMYRGRTRVDALLDEHRVTRLRPGPGDLLVFDGGRSFHEVLPVQGTHTRWTAGGFLAMAQDQARFYRWS